MAGGLAALALVFAGCVGASPSPATPVAESTSAASASATAAPTTPPTPTVPVLVRGGTAADNLPVFKATVDSVWASPQNVTGRAYIDALIAVGFDKTAMQLTSDSTTVGNPAESIQFSVLWGDQCLVGQVGPATGTAVTTVLPALTGGTCLIGATVPID